MFELPLISMLVNLWNTVRGFAFASSWMEMYNETRKRNYNAQRLSAKKLTTSRLSSSQEHVFVFEVWNEG